jgi:hypothetical protein
MLVKELQAYVEVQSAFESLKKAHLQNLISQEVLKKKLKAVVESDKQFFGFFPKVSRNLKLTGLKEKLSAVDSEVYIKGKMLSLSAKAISRYAVPAIASRKDTLLREILNDLALSRSKNIGQELAFWNEIIIENEEQFKKSQNRNR